MAISQEQANTANVFHEVTPSGRDCNDRRGPVRWRRNGRTQRWKRQPERFSIPVKWGLKSYGRIENNIAEHFHTGADCPVEPEGHN